MRNDGQSGQFHALPDFVIRTPRLELRPPTERSIEALYEVAEAGIHLPAEMPFGVAWTDTLTRDSFLEYHRSFIEDWRPEDWTCNFVAVLEGRVVGTQGVFAERFPERRLVSTGSWLGQDWQGRGLGTEQRAGVLEFAFRILGARAATTGAVATNRASQRVSEKLGYTLVGESTVTPRDEPVPHLDYRLEASDWLCPYPVTIEGDVQKSRFGA